METIIKFIFFTVLIIYLLGLLGRVLFRYWLRKKQREIEEQLRQGGGFGQQYGSAGSARQKANNEAEGEVVVQQTQRVRKKVSEDVGEYVEFEEVSETEKKDK